MSDRTYRTTSLVGAVVAAGVILVTAAPRGASAALDLSWHTVDGGGATSLTGGSYSLGATAGQADAGVLAGGTYQLKGGFWRGGVTFTTSVEQPGGVAGGAGSEPVAGAPAEFRYAGAAPNPFNPQTVISFQLPARRDVALRIYTATGELVRELVSEPLDAGQHRVSWDGTDERGAIVASGIYYLRLVAGAEKAEQKLVLLK